MLRNVVLRLKALHDLRAGRPRAMTFDEDGSEIGGAELECNVCSCHRQGRSGQSIADLRDALADVGWYIDAANDVDVCPTHIPEPGRIS